MSLSFRGKSNNLKIFYVIGSLEIGGAESQMSMLSLALIGRGHHCEVFALNANGPLSSMLREAGIVVHDGNFPYAGTTLKKMVSLILVLAKLWLHAIRIRPDVMHAYLPLTNFIGAIAGKAACVPVIITSRRGLGNHQDRNPGWKWFDRIANKFSTKVTVNSQAVAEDVIKRDAIDSRKIACIHNGLNFERFRIEPGIRAQMRLKLDVSSEVFLWVKVANLIPYKGHSDLLKAFAILANKSTKLILIGENRGIQKILQEQAQNLGIRERVTFLGQRSDIPQLLSAMDGYVMASHEEGFSNAILEAMAVGLPIVATSVGGNNEALQGGKLGVLVPVSNPVAMADAMNRLMIDVSYRAQISRDARRAVNEQYSVDAMVNSHINLYQSDR
ncbi:MAG: glycosyltransferase [Ramlibacter sp.]|nr:glycosyltransferase [Ramlibacter sp.]